MSRIKDDQPNICYLCGVYGHMDEHHIFEGSTRKTCDRHRLTVHVCRKCHSELHDKGGDKMDFLHRLGQKVYEEEIGSRQDFIRDYIRSYM